MMANANNSARAAGGITWTAGATAEVDGLAEARNLKLLLDFLRLMHRRDADDRDGRQRGIRELLLAEAPAVHDRHHQVEQHDAGAALAHLLERDRAILRRHRFVAARGEQQVQHLADVFVVLNYQHTGHLHSLRATAQGSLGEDAALPRLRRMLHHPAPLRDARAAPTLQFSRSVAYTVSLASSRLVRGAAHGWGARERG
jgi:hypothetical protein